MAELVRPSLDNTKTFFRRVGLMVDRFDFQLVYPGVFRERRVTKVYDKKRREVRVLKARPFDDNGKREIESMMKIMGTYRFSGGHFNGPEVHALSQYIVLNMPFLGYDLGELAQILNLKDLGYSEDDKGEFNFRGFSYGKIDSLCNQLRRDHLAFANQHRLIHGDVWQYRQGTNNIVYHPKVDRLLLVDAEALAKPDDLRYQSFHEQLDRVQEWMHASLLE